MCHLSKYGELDLNILPVMHEQLQPPPFPEIFDGHRKEDRIIVESLKI